jgi:hypothetical protein
MRRRLWIPNATVESVPARIDPADGKRIEAANGEVSDQARNTDILSGSRPLVDESGGNAGGRRARWKLARLKSYARRSERRAVSAIKDASTFFASAHQAVLHAALARKKADDTCLSPCQAVSSRRNR